MSNKLLFDEHPLVILPSLAKEIGLNEAIILQQIHYWLVIAEKAKDSGKFYEGRWWTFGTYVDWQEQFPWWSIDTVGRVVRKLEKDGLLLSRKPDAKDWNQRKWYTIEYGKLPQSRDAICRDGEPQVATILNESETPSEISPKKKATPSAPDTLSSLDYPKALLNTPFFIVKWREWWDYRKEIEKPLKATTAKKQLAFLETQGREAVEVLEQSMVNGWTGLFPLKKNGHPPTKPAAPPQYAEEH